MTIKLAFSLRNLLIFLCLCGFLLLGWRGTLIAGKMEALDEAGALYASGDLIAAEAKYREAAAMDGFIYKEEELRERLEELAPVTAIREGLLRLVRLSEKQSAEGDFDGLLRTYNEAVVLKARYMTPPGGPYEETYRRLAAESGLSDLLTARFLAFKQQYIDEMEAAAAAGSGETGEGVKRSLLLIPEGFYGGEAQKAAGLAERFRSYDTGKLKRLAGAGHFQGLLDAALADMKVYQSLGYEAPWIAGQTEESAGAIIDKDLRTDNAAAFASHASSYRSFAASAGLEKSAVLNSIDNGLARMIRLGERMAESGKFEQASALFAQLSGLTDTTEYVAAVRQRRLLAEPVLLLPGGENEGAYALTASGHGRYGSQVYVAGVDANGMLQFASMNGEGNVIHMSAGLEGPVPSALVFDEGLGQATGGPVAVVSGVENTGAGQRFTAYGFGQTGTSLLFDLTADSYALQADGTLHVEGDASAMSGGSGGWSTTGGTGNAAGSQTAVYTLRDGRYQFDRLLRQYVLIEAERLYMHPFEDVAIELTVTASGNGAAPAYADDGTHLMLNGPFPFTEGMATVYGQYQYGSEMMETDYGYLQAPVFVVDKVE